MRAVRASILVVACAMCFSVGCSHPHHDVDRCSGARLTETGPQVAIAGDLLFDRYPGRYNATDFAVRSDWPSTISYYSPGQVLSFSERFVDVTGRSFGESDYTYRRSESIRVGVGYR